MPIDGTEHTGAEAQAERAITARQALVLEFITGYIREHGWAPSLREIGRYMGIGSTNGVNDHLRALERKGYITRDSMKSRAIRVIGAAVTFAEPEAARQPWVYFAQSTTDLRIKIGFSVDATRRLGDIRYERRSPLVLLARIPGGIELERRIHARFAELRIEGEWFRPDQRLVMAIQRLRDCRTPFDIDCALEES